MTLLELLDLIKRHIKLVVLLPLVCAIAMAGYSWLAMPDEYTSSVSLYALTRSEADSGTGAPTNTEFTASQMLSNDLAQLIESGRVIDQTASSLNKPDLNDFDIEVASDTSTRVITLSVTSTSPNETAEVANALANNTSELATEIMDVESVSILNTAEKPDSPSGPNRTMYIAVALLAGLFAAIAIVVLKDMLDSRIRKPEDAAELLDLPIIGRIPVIKG